MPASTRKQLRTPIRLALSLSPSEGILQGCINATRGGTREIMRDSILSSTLETRDISLRPLDSTQASPNGNRMTPGSPHMLTSEAGMIHILLAPILAAGPIPGRNDPIRSGTRLSERRITYRLKGILMH